MFKRVVIKVSGEQLAAKNHNFDDTFIKRIVLEIDAARTMGCEISLVVGGGNIWRGRDAKQDMNKAKAHQIGIVATIINALYLSEQMKMHTGREAVVMTPFDICSFTTRFNQDYAIALMKAGGIPIFAGGTGHPFVSTDTVVAIRACELSAEAVLYGKTVNAVYERDPRHDPQAKMFRTVSYKRVLHDSLSVADISALSITNDANIPCAVFGLSIPGSITKACQGPDALVELGGTYISNNSMDIIY